MDDKPLLWVKKKIRPNPNIFDQYKLAGLNLTELDKGCVGRGGEGGHLVS